MISDLEIITVRQTGGINRKGPAGVICTGGVWRSCRRHFTQGRIGKVVAQAGGQPLVLQGVAHGNIRELTLGRIHQQIVGISQRFKILLNRIHREEAGGGEIRRKSTDTGATNECSLEVHTLVHDKGIFFTATIDHGIGVDIGELDFVALYFTFTNQRQLIDKAQANVIRLDYREADGAVIFLFKSELQPFSDIAEVQHQRRSLAGINHQRTVPVYQVCQARADGAGGRLHQIIRA